MDEFTSGHELPQAEEAEAGVGPGLISNSADSPNLDLSDDRNMSAMARMLEGRRRRLLAVPNICALQVAMRPHAEPPPLSKRNELLGQGRNAAGGERLLRGLRSDRHQRPPEVDVVLPLTRLPDIVSSRYAAPE
ncbi:hypothetical protein GGTG_05517 [Gaeumannomyces tritici R3-111a-1]|uniref:Uncharacterized protein n=1 Tax=Gaeumannomyces tritici (strain R3-111a-1) TaxID=644352 RepID=J3NW52_GAET3|nr:hypothetical protein GGTG_05517 [Gaeumannomyces tritici R3-111a-1]EJT75584.1 hypothetical protein GGTG_05517 [Gaeumannomyces tritici R3-111a-1]